MIKFDNFTIEGSTLSMEVNNSEVNICPEKGRDETERITMLIQSRMKHCLDALNENLNYIDHVSEMCISWQAPNKTRGHFTPFTYKAMEQYIKDKKLSTYILVQAQKEMFFERHSLGCSDYDADELFNYLHELLAYAFNCEATGHEFKYPEK